MIKPILFNTDMVRAILDGRKTVTRRCVKFLNGKNPNWTGYVKDGLMLYNGTNEPCIKPCQYHPGDIMYVRETWAEWTDGCLYKAWTSPFPQPGKSSVMKWHPSIHMPKEAARIWLKVKDVRVERLQEITANEKAKEGLVSPCCMCRNEEDGKCEGGDRLLKDCPIECIDYSFMKLWNSTIKKSDLDLYGWDVNPWVWVIEFERAEKGE